ncbi:hypothetical protein F5144DRAFT_233803 [Chaetomium tenue]|uniref:Uncharacterized protein n=1 Tax=Chaetomium tenue TaxID=1854479 RepID=A0ACB7P9N1_9PEZI|nr:hypothetical protein F5144DRAFT_233803 [Chaetomium globosum]
MSLGTYRRICQSSALSRFGFNDGVKNMGDEPEMCLFTRHACGCHMPFRLSLRFWRCVVEGVRDGVVSSRGICLRRRQRPGVVRSRSSPGARQVGCWLSGALTQWLWVRRRSCSRAIKSRKSVGCPFWRIQKECALSAHSSRLRPLLVLCCWNARVHILCSCLIRPLTPFGNLGAGFKGKRRRPRHGRRRVASSTSSASRTGSCLCQVKAKACRVRYSSALAERRPRVVASVAGWPHGGRAAEVGEDTGRSERLPDNEGGTTLHEPVSTGSPPGETSFQAVP